MSEEREIREAARNMIERYGDEARHEVKLRIRELEEHGQSDARRYWDFRSPGRGDVEFEDIIVALNDIGYAGPLSVEWEDIRMDRIHGASEAASFVRSLDFEGSNVAFDAAFDKEKQ